MNKLNSPLALATFLLFARPGVSSSRVPQWLRETRPERQQHTPAGLLRKQFSNSHQRNLQGGAMEQCQADAQQNEDFLEDIGLECRCREGDEGVVLLCMDECAYCNDAHTVCGVQAAQALYDLDTGLRTGIGGAFDYVTGFHDTVAVENLGCEEQNGLFICETCHVYVNGERCNSCELISCEDGTVAESIECENIEHDAIFNFCEDLSITEDSVFTALSSNQFEECLPLDILGSPSRPEGSGKGSKNGKGSKKSSNGKGGKGGKGSKKSGASSEYYGGSPIFEEETRSGKRAKTRR